MPKSLMTFAPRFGWNNTAVLANGVIELVVTLDVGPRIISFSSIDGPNILKTFPSQLGGTSEPDWKIRGGHRLWLAPESSETYFPDNHPVDYEQTAPGSLTLRSPAETSTGVTKTMDITISETDPAVRITHRILANRDIGQPIAAWALTVLAEDGIARVPQPGAASHPGNASDNPGDGYLPNRAFSLWPYTNIRDSRFDWQSDTFNITQQSHSLTQAVEPTKIGFLHQLGDVSYEVAQWRFTKTVPYNPVAVYPDHQTNLEIYTDGEILEIETLSPMTRLVKGDVITHTEHWSLAPIR